MIERGPAPAAIEAPAGDHPALAVSFEDFYEVEQGGLFGAMILATRDRQEAEDLTQEAFLKVWERWNVIQGLDNPTGYLYRTAMNAFFSRRRRMAMAGRRLIAQAVRSDPLTTVDARDQIDRALADLTPRQRVALVLTDLLGFPPGEVAETMGVTGSTARVLLARARETMRAAIGER